MPKERNFKSTVLKCVDDVIVVEAPDGLGAAEAKLLHHYRASGPRRWVFMVRAHTPKSSGAFNGPHAWGEDLW